MQAIPEDLFVNSYEKGTALKDPTMISTRLILAPLNEEVSEINTRIQELLVTEERIYLSSDTPIGSKTFDPYYMADHQVEVLNQKRPSGFPSFKLQVFL